MARVDDDLSRAPLSFLPAPVRGAISSFLLGLNTIVCVLAMFPLAVVKFAVPAELVRKRLDRMLNGIAQAWITINGLWISLAGEVRWIVSGVESLSPSRWYLVEANHQSWVDIFALQKVLSRRIPMLKFFLKRELIWVPLIGAAWWALDFPFMRRHSEAFLREHPEKKGEDLAAIRRACEKFALIPTSVMNFLEGTRFTELPIPGNLLNGNYSLDAEYKERIQKWVHELWAEKDQMLELERQKPGGFGCG